jgi:hypothetical protein
MGLLPFIRTPEVKAKLKLLRPKAARKIGVPLLVEPQSKRFMLVGSAFDYLLRFELQRRAPHTLTDKWTAEYAPEILWGVTEKGGRGLDVFVDLEPKYYMAPAEVANRARTIILDSKAAVSSYVQCQAPEHDEQVDLAAHAIRLAKLDDVYHASRLDRRFQEADHEDVDDLLAMLAVVPFDALIHPSVMLLNPNFGQASKLVGGADADLIGGDMLVDFKTTKSDEVTADNLDQLLGYFLLGRHQRRVGATFPEINRFALYFCRHGHLWVQDASTWIDHPQFSLVEEWFFKRAQEVFSTGNHSLDA